MKRDIIVIEEWQEKSLCRINGRGYMTILPGVQMDVSHGVVMLVRATKNAKIGMEVSVLKEEKSHTTLTGGMASQLLFRSRLVITCNCKINVFFPYEKESIQISEI